MDVRFLDDFIIYSLPSEGSTVINLIKYLKQLNIEWNGPLFCMNIFILLHSKDKQITTHAQKRIILFFINDFISLRVDIMYKVSRKSLTHWGRPCEIIALKHHFRHFVSLRLLSPILEHYIIIYNQINNVSVCWLLRYILLII